MTDAPSARSSRLSSRRFSQLIASFLAIGLLLLLVIAGVTVWLAAKSRDYNRWVDHTYAAEAKVYRLQSLLERTETARRGYMLSHDEATRRSYEAFSAAVPRALGEIDLFTRDNPVQQRHVADLWPLVDRSVAAPLPTASPPGGLGVAGLDRDRVERTRRLTASMAGEEARLLIQRTERERYYTGLLLTVVLIGVALIAVLALGSVWVIARYATDLGRSERALRGLNEGLEDAVRERTADLTRANEEIQRFAYIVSHDLRSPLVNVMGFTSELEQGIAALRKMLERVEERAPELVTPDARLALRDELPEAIEFIRTSTRKMDRLINAILKLSREGRRTLSPDPVDVGAMVQAIAQSLKHVADERTTEIVAESELPGIVTDRLALEQVLSNLIENAVKYMAPGRAGRVTVRGRSEGARRIYEVVDNGRGIDPRDHERIFELFRRSGAQDQKGEGIGLAHVRALVHRMGGTITCISALDQGATFRLSLPAILQPEPRTAA